MNATEQGLLHAVVHEPDDDTHRLIYADWLDDHGNEERAEFVRAQVQLARDPVDSPQRRELAFRAWRWLERGQSNPDWIYLGLDPRYRRGFIEALTLDGDALVEACPGFHRYPLRHVEIIELGGDLELLRNLPADNRLLGLDLTGAVLGSDDLPFLDSLANLPHLERLSLQFCILDDEAIPLLCELPLFQRLSLLRVGANPFTGDGRERLREHFGGRVCFVAEREDHSLYAMTTDRRFVTGHLPDHRQALLLSLDNTARVALFDFEGRLLEIAERPLPSGVDDIFWVTAAWKEFAIRWKEEVGLTESTIRVRRFRLDDHRGIRDYAANWTQDADAPNLSDEDFESLRRWIERWLDQNKFAWDWGRGDWWLDRNTGEVTDT